MGTYGALNYGSKLSPYALILAKPLTEMGTVAENERINRPGVFATSLDLLMKNYGSLSRKDVLEFNKRLWKNLIMQIGQILNLLFHICMRMIMILMDIRIF